MKRRGWSIRVVVRYTLFQLPAVAVLILILLLIRRWLDIPGWVLGGIVAAWVAKDVIVFPFVWRSYDRDLKRNAHSMIGMRGIAKERLAPSGYVQVHGELWLAEVMGGGQPIERGEVVQVRKIRGLTLLVQPANHPNGERGGKAPHVTYDYGINL